MKKRCGRCKEEAHRKFFSKAKRAKDGLSTYCKPCQAKYAKERYGRRNNLVNPAYSGRTYESNIDPLHYRYPE